VWKGTPSTPFGTKLDLTTKPMGTSTKVAKTSVQDTGNFGAVGDTNKEVKMDLSLRTAKDLAPVSTANQFGKRMVYSRVSPPISK
jgi:predicted nucleotide-binding protein